MCGVIGVAGARSVIESWQEPKVLPPSNMALHRDKQCISSLNIASVSIEGWGPYSQRYS